MATFDDIGGPSDTVVLSLGGKDLVITEQYEVHQSFLTQPSAFSCTLGSGDTAADIIKLAPPNTDFELRIGNVTQFVGKTDGYTVSGPPTRVHIRGRDNMAPLHDSHVRSDTSFSEDSYEKLVQKVLSLVPIVGYSLFTDNSADRKRRTGGVPIVQTGVPDYLADVLFTVLGSKRKVQAKAGERWYHYLKKELDLAGLFLFAGVDGTFILTAPNANQKPTYRIVRQADALRNVVNVTQYHWTNETTNRYSECVIVGRGGGGTTGRTRNGSTFSDEEMKGFGFDRPLVKKSKRAASSAEADFMARKLIAQANLQGHKLVYTVAGHTTPSLFGGQRAVWTVDTIVDVQDDELGIKAPYWLESAAFRRSEGGTSTELTLCRPQDLVFGLSEE